MKQWMVFCYNNSFFTKKFFKTWEQAFDYTFKYLDIERYNRKFKITPEYDGDFCKEVDGKVVNIINISQNSERLKVKRLKSDRAELNKQVQELRESNKVLKSQLDQKQKRIDELKEIMNEADHDLFNIFSSISFSIEGTRIKLAKIAGKLSKTEKMNVICSYCQKFIKTVPCTEENKNHTSHGCCPECHEKEINQLKRKMGVIE